MGSQILEKQEQLRQGVGDGCAGKESRSEVAPGTFLYGAYGIQKIEGAVTALGVAEAGNTVVTGVEREVLEIVSINHACLDYLR